MKKINEIAKTNYKPFNYYGNKQATKLIIAMGSVCETIKEVIDKNNEYGLIEVHLYRPFSKEFLINEIPNTIKTIAVLDRTKEQGSIGEPLYLDVVTALKDKNLNIVGGRYGLSSKNTTPSQIKAVYDMLENNPRNNFTIGINDDVTNLSLKVNENYKTSTSKEILIYGYGSDGMVGASKSIIKLIGDNSDNYVQGYFQYDSKKSGGVTVSHLRFNKEPIKSTYYVENPSIVVTSKDSYLNYFDVISNIKDNGIFILNTSKSKNEVNEFISNNIKKTLIEKNIKLYIINAYDISNKLGLGNKISTILESVILKLSNIIDYNTLEEKMIENVKNKFSRKGEDIVNKNIEAIKSATKYIEEVNYDNNYIENKDQEDTLLQSLLKRKGNELPVSSFINNIDGTFEADTSKLQKNGFSELVPSWIKENCIQCNMCSIVCPHGVIRPFVLNKEEYDKAPSNIKEQCKPLTGKDDYYFTLGISVNNCTGCGLCIKQCPSKEKSLISKEFIDEKHIQDNFDYLNRNISYKPLFNENTIKGLGFVEPKFKYHGACAGCGETNYIKVLTQLFGDNLMIANATGCSSIYGGSMPSSPYNIPWINSLLEDNAEFGYGIVTANNYNRNRIKEIMESNLDNPNKEYFEKWLNNYDNYEITKEVYDKLDYSKVPKELISLKDYIPSRVVFMVGGDGWAYDIGYSGIDHVLSRNDNVNILVLDTEVYSNTGGQSSKSSRIGSIASFTSDGKEENKKDLARLALTYPHVFVAQISFGMNPLNTIKILREAALYNGPSIIIAYSPCISHGIKGGMGNSIESGKLAVESGFFPVFHYNPQDKKFNLDYKNPNFDLYDDFLNSQTRFSMLKTINPIKGEELLKKNKENAIERFEFYKELESK